jgi:hypothetical protein
MVATRPAPADARGTQLDAAASPPGRPRRPWWEGLETWTGAAIVVACCVFVLFQLQPDLLLRNTTPAGGDTGAHVWWPAFLRDHLLPQGRIAGWAPDWFAGFPAGQFYFPFPALVIVALDTVLPYNIAFKVVTALGPIALPAGAYVFGRGLRAPRPAPALFAVGATVLLFFKGAPGTDAEATRIAGNQHIMGGNLASNFAGEFSFTLALALALFFLGALAYSLEHRRRMWLPAVLFAAVVMSHLVVGMFAVVGAVIVWLARRPYRTFPTVAAIGGVGALLTAIWTFPLLATLGYTSDMGYEPIGHGPGGGLLGEFGLYMFPWYPAYVLWMLPLIVAAIVGGILPGDASRSSSPRSPPSWGSRSGSGRASLTSSTAPPSGTCGSCRSGTSGSCCSQCSAPPSSSGARARCWGGCPIRSGRRSCRRRSRYRCRLRAARHRSRRRRPSTAASRDRTATGNAIAASSWR